VNFDYYGNVGARRIAEAKNAITRKKEEDSHSPWEKTEAKPETKKKSGGSGGWGEAKVQSQGVFGTGRRSARSASRMNPYLSVRNKETV